MPRSAEGSPIKSPMESTVEGPVGSPMGNTVEGQSAAAANAVAEQVSRTVNWVRGVSYWQDYLTIIELEEPAGPGQRTAS